MKYTLPKIRGTYEENASLAPLTNFKVGGPAEVLFTPADRDDLITFLLERDEKIPLTILGMGSNLIIPDKGLHGVVVKIGTPTLGHINTHDNVITVEAGCSDAKIAQFALTHSLTGFEFLASIPGSIGGGIKTNAGCYGTDISQILRTLTFTDLQGKVQTITNAECEFAYRTSQFNYRNDYIFLEASLQGTPASKEVISAKMEEYKQRRRDSQPMGIHTFGSTFKNPDGHSSWKLIKESGADKLRVGDIHMSEKHANFMQNDGDGTAADAIELIRQIQERVREKTGIELVPEVLILS
jgi:UDP-N-acetylmuramate dehydrogenase